MSAHISDALSQNSQYPVHHWIRKHGRENIRMSVLEECPEDLEYLNYVERYWIRALKDLGHTLLNISEGGKGVLGVPAWNKGLPMSVEQKELLRSINIGKVLTEDHRISISMGVVKHFEQNGHKSVYEFWVDKYGEDEAMTLLEAKRAKASASLSGIGNPMYGRSGLLAPAYGRVAEKHPMFGTHHTEEAKKKISEKTKGRPKPEATRLRMSFGQHRRLHMITVKPSCRWCLGDSLEDVLKEKDTALDGDVG
jgi:hypothetical protein